MTKNGTDYPTWASIVTTALVVIWFFLAAAAFAGLYVSLSNQFDKPELLSATLGVMVWPFIVFVVALPAITLLAANVRHLLGLKKTIDDAPKKLLEAFDTAENLRLNLQETGGRITNDINSALGEIETRMTHFEGRLQRQFPQAPAPPAGAPQLSPRERLAAHLEAASERFYDVLESWNSDGRRKGNQLVVTRGGGNRRELVEALRIGGAFDRNHVELNNRTAHYLSTAFAKQLSARRGGITPGDVEELDRLKQEADAVGAAF